VERANSSKLNSTASSPSASSGGPSAVQLGDDLGSRWHTLEDSEEATAHVASLEAQVCQLSALVAEKNGSIENLKGEWQHMRLQLTKLEECRLESRRECEAKESALNVATSRIASLEDEVLQTHARCATSEEDYEALRESFTTQKEATKLEMSKFQEECGRRIDEIRTECERLLEASNETVRDLKASIGEVELERGTLRVRCAEQDEKVNKIGEMLKAHIVLSDRDEVRLSRRVIREVFPEVDGYAFSAAVGLPCDIKEGEEKDDEIPKNSNMSMMERSARHEEQRFEVGRKLAEKASAQACTIAELQDANEVKDAQLQALQEMVESLLLERGENADRSQWGHRFHKWKDGMNNKLASTEPERN
jgi:hypothetical protein